jgi:hypothetical protein
LIGTVFVAGGLCLVLCGGSNNGTPSTTTTGSP